MSEKEILGVVINLIVWPLILYWIFKSRTERKESERNFAEYNKPENKFKRELEKLKLSLKTFEKRNQYPYIMAPSYGDKQKSAPPEYMTDGFDRHTFRSIDEIKTGKSEFKLYSCLSEHFGNDKIFIGNHTLFGFYPDILYVDKLNKIFIDIEIDEPYVLNSNEPIHYFHIGVDENGKKFLDDPNLERDKAFRKYGWTVVRFSERQVLSTTLKCCEVINHVVSYWSLQKTNFTLEECEIEVEKRWNKDEAKTMSIGKARQSNYSIEKENQEAINTKIDNPEPTTLVIDDAGDELTPDYIHLISKNELPDTTYIFSLKDVQLYSNLIEDLKYFSVDTKNKLNQLIIEYKEQVPIESEERRRRLFPVFQSKIDYYKKQGDYKTAKFLEGEYTRLKEKNQVSNIGFFNVALQIKFRSKAVEYFTKVRDFTFI